MPRLKVYGASTKRPAPPPPKPKQTQSESPSSPYKGAREHPRSPRAQKRAESKVSPVLGTSAAHDGSKGPRPKPGKPAPPKPERRLSGEPASMSSQDQLESSSQDSSASSKDREPSPSLQRSVAKSLLDTSTHTPSLSENDDIPSKKLPSQPIPTIVTLGPGKEAGSQLLVISPAKSRDPRQRSTAAPVVFKIPPPPPKAAKSSPDQSPDLSGVKSSKVESSNVKQHELIKARDEEEGKALERTKEDIDREEQSDTDQSSADSSDSDGIIGYDTSSATQLYKSADDSSTSSDDEQVESDLPPLKTKTSNLPSESSHSSPEESDDNQGEDTYDESSGGIVLLSVEPKSTSFTVSESFAVNAEQAARDVGSARAAESKEPLTAVRSNEPGPDNEEEHAASVSGGFRELDTMLSSLRNLIADTCEIGGKEELVPTKAPESAGAESIDFSSIKQMAPPPDTSSHLAPNPQPSAVRPPLKPKPVPLQDRSELLQKLRKRREVAVASPPKKGEPDQAPPAPLRNQDPVATDGKHPGKAEAGAPSVSSCGSQTGSARVRGDSSLSAFQKDFLVTSAPSSVQPSVQVPTTWPSSGVTQTQMPSAQTELQAPQTKTGSSAGPQMPQAQSDSQVLDLQRLQWQSLHQQQLMQQQMLAMQQMQHVMASGLPQAQTQQMLQQILLQQQQLVAGSSLISGPLQAGLDPNQTGPNPVQAGLGPAPPPFVPMQASLNAMPVVHNTMQVGPGPMPAGLSPMPPGPNPVPTASIAPVAGQPSSGLPLMPVGGVMLGTPYAHGQVPSASLQATQLTQMSPVTATPTPLPRSSQKLSVASDEPAFPTLTSTPVASATGKTGEAEMRSSALGSAEKKFDTLMEEMKESDPADLLRKTPTDSDDGDTKSSYTEMTAALLEAMQERRKHVGHTPSRSGHNLSHSIDDQSNDWDA